MENDPSQQLDNLSKDQLETLRTVKTYVQEKKLLDEQRATDWNLLRFCRARNFNAEKVLEMIEKFCRWFYPSFCDVGIIEVTSYEKLRSVYGHGFHKTDKEGRPIYIEKVCELDVNEIFSSYSDEQLTRYYVQSYERMVNVILPECSRAANRRIDQCVNIIDLSGVNALSLFVGKTKQFLSFAVEIAQNYYPELMHKTFIVNAGYLFSGAWMVIKGWLDPKTQAKMKIFSGSGKTDLLKDIDAENLPRFLGGNSEGDIRMDIGPWSQELQKARGQSSLFHSDQRLVRTWYPSIAAAAIPDSAGLEDPLEGKKSPSREL